MRRLLNHAALLYCLAAAEHRIERLRQDLDDAQLRRVQQAEAAEKRAEQADARRRQAVSCALAVADLAEQWRIQLERLQTAYARLENAECGARDALHHERRRKPPRPYVIRDDPGPDKDAA